MTPFMCMAVAIFFEAGNQSYEGKLAVGNVIENRVQSNRYPDDICSVVYDGKAFSFTHDGKSDDPTRHTDPADVRAWEDSRRAARVIMNGELDVRIVATHYHANYVNPWWADKITYVGRIDDHLFYEE